MAKPLPNCRSGRSTSSPDSRKKHDAKKESG
jgi:hypothetical protein